MKNNDIINLKDRLAQRDGLKCALTGKKVSSVDDLDIEHIKPVSEGGVTELDNLILVTKEMNRSIGKNNSYRTKMLIERLESRQKELDSREKEAFEREEQYRNELAHQKVQLEKYRQQLQEEQYERERLLTKEMESRKSHFSQQEKYLAENAAQLKRENEESERLRTLLSEEKKSLELAVQELEKEKERYREESRRQIEEKSSNYVNAALESLEAKEAQYHLTSKRWSLFGAFSISLGIAILVYFGIEGFNVLESKDNVNWSFLLLVSFKGVIIVGLFIALSKYAFTFSQSYMHESLKNSERRHAINFGKFYLESYGADADWNQVKEAFEHWNITSNSAFSKHNSDSFDPKILENAANLIDSVSKITSKTVKKSE